MPVLASPLGHWLLNSTWAGEAEDAKRRHQGQEYTRGGEPVFRGTRVPFKILIEYLEGGDTLDQFLEQYPSVSRDLAIAAIEEARSSLVSQLK
jgi:uncharacterized protein (DUF433 family)